MKRIGLIVLLAFFSGLPARAGLPLDGAVLRSPLDGGGQAVSNAVLVDCQIVAGGPYDRDYFSITSTPYSTTFTGHLSGVVVTNQDRVEALYTTFSHKGRQLLPWAPYAGTSAVYQLSTTATNVVVDTNTLQVSFTSDGTADVTVVNGDYSRVVTLDSGLANLYTNRYIYGGITGSLRYALSAAFDAAISNNTNALIYSVQDHGNTNYVRNTNCWAYGLADLSCASPWNSYAGSFCAGTAVTPRHIIYAMHYPMPTGTVLRFVDMTNGVHQRTLIDYRYPANDIAIGLLDSDLPASIVPAKVLKDYERGEYLPGPPIVDERLNNSQYMQLPALSLNRMEEVSVNDVGELGGYTVTASRSAAHADRAAHYILVVGGDSGNPVMLICDGFLVLLTTWHGPSTGPSLSYYASAIESAMQEMGGAYTNLTYVNYGDYLQVATNLPPTF